MKLQFDHLVYFLNRPLQEAIEWMHSKGIHAAIGGSHTSWGTHNALAYFDLSYIEFLSVENMHKAQQATSNGLISQLLYDLPKGEGFGQVAIRTDDIFKLASYLKGKGKQVHVEEGQRKTAAGEVIQWKMLFLENDFSSLPFPFFIQWLQKDEERRKALLRNPAFTPHPLGEVRLKEVVYVVKDLHQTIFQWQNLFGLSSSPAYYDATLHAQCQRLLLPGGDLLFCQGLGEGLAQEILNQKGERPFKVVLAHGNKIIEIT